MEQIGRELGAQFVIEGSVTRSGGRVRINVRLLSVNDQAQVWAKSYEKEFGDLLAWQWAIASEIAGEVKPPCRRALTNRRINPFAYENYLKGLHHWNKTNARRIYRGDPAVRTGDRRRSHIPAPLLRARECLHPARHSRSAFAPRHLPERAGSGG